MCRRCVGSSVRPAVVEAGIAEAAEDSGSSATAAARRVHERLLPVTPTWDADQRWALAQEFADVALGESMPP